jgi:hypothetical protein
MKQRRIGVDIIASAMAIGLVEIRGARKGWAA